MKISDYTYEGMRRLNYIGAYFIPVCDKCGRFVKADDVVYQNDITGVADQPNATCKKCGRIEMIFEGYY